MRYWYRALLLSLLYLQLPAAHAEFTYVRKSAGRAETVIFVHGVLGNARETWVNTQTRAWWPQLVVADPAFERVNVATLELPSSLWRRGPGVDELADIARLALEGDESIRNQRLIFVAHSMGGVVVRALLSKYRDYAARTRMLFFLGVPTTGSSMARIAQVVSPNLQFQSLESMQNDSFLATLQRTWLAAPELRSLRTFCAYELRPTLGVMVVEQQSATNLCNERLDPIDGDHSAIAKPAGLTGPSHLALRAAYRTTGAGNRPRTAPGDEDADVPPSLIRQENLIANCIYDLTADSEPFDSPRWRCRHEGYAYITAGSFGSERHAEVVSARLQMRGIQSSHGLNLGLGGSTTYYLSICLPSERQAEIALTCLTARNYPAQRLRVMKKAE